MVKMMGIKEYVKHSGLSELSVRRLCHTESFPKIRVGTRYKIPWERADAWLEAEAERNAQLESA